MVVQSGDYASAGGRNIAVVDPDPFWMDGYFEETKIGAIHLGDAARVKLMGYGQVIDGHVQSIAR
jgi:multidrug resistance efflux pump